jgi:hypothetical protein
MRMIHALKLYYNRIYSFLDYIPDGRPDEKDDLTKEATETLLQIRDIENKLEHSLDEQFEALAEVEGLLDALQPCTLS